MLETFWRLVLNKGELGRSLFDVELPVESIPLRFHLSLSRLSLLCLLLASCCQLFELVLADLHVRSYHRKSYRVHSLVPVGSLLWLIESLYDDRVGFGHVGSHQLENVIRIKQKEWPFGGLIVHTLRCKDQTTQQIWTKLGELRFGLAT